MPKQFDVFLNPLRSRTSYPLLVVLQSPFAELANTRIVAPAIRAPAGALTGGVLAPRFVVDGQAYTLQTFQLTSMKVAELKNPIANIADARDQITKALDHLFHDNS
jgi:toxin CcdB